MESSFALKQEARRKNIERLFKVLQARFGILREDIKLCFIDDMVRILKACVFLHNMTALIKQDGLFSEDIEKERRSLDILSEIHDNDKLNAVHSKAENASHKSDANMSHKERCESFIVRHVFVTSAIIHKILKLYLIQYIGNEWVFNFTNVKDTSHGGFSFRIFSITFPCHQRGRPRRISSE